MTYEFFPFAGVCVLLAFTISYFADERIKFFKEVGIRKTELIVVKKFKFLFAYPRRGGNTVTKFILFYMILLYAIVLISAMFLILHLITGIGSLLTTSWLILTSSGFVALRVSVAYNSFTGITPEQQKILGTVKRWGGEAIDTKITPEKRILLAEERQRRKNQEETG